MSYKKPQINAKHGAMDAIQSTTALKGSPFVIDNADGSRLPTATNTAYEADE